MQNSKSSMHQCPWVKGGGEKTRPEYSRDFYSTKYFWKIFKTIYIIHNIQRTPPSPTHHPSHHATICHVRWLFNFFPFCLSFLEAFPHSRNSMRLYPNFVKVFCRHNSPDTTCCKTVNSIKNKALRVSKESKDWQVKVRLTGWPTHKTSSSVTHNHYSGGVTWSAKRQPKPLWGCLKLHLKITL